MKKFTHLSLALLASSALSSSLYADETTEVEKLKQEIQELRQMVQTLMNQKTTAPDYAALQKSIKEDKEQIAELKETTQALIDETSDLKSGFNYTTVDTTKSHSGLASAASKVYYSKSPLSILDLRSIQIKNGIFGELPMSLYTNGTRMIYAF